MSPIARQILDFLFGPDVPTVRRAVVADVPLILQLLRATPNPPNEDEESIAGIIQRQPVYIDPAAPAICRLVKRADADFIDVPWWTWLGGDMEAKLGPVWAAAISATIDRYGASSRTWGIGGQLSGFGADDAAKRADADMRTEALRVFLQEGLAPDKVNTDRALNGVDGYIESTVGHMAERMGIA